MNNIPNRQAICETLLEEAKVDKDIIVLCSDSRGSASLTPFFNAFPKQAIEMGIAEQNLVSVASGLAKCDKKPFVASPACFLTTRSYEQCKVDVAYSNTNVKLIGISGGISYGALGMTHHSSQDIACMASVPNMRVYIPSDRFQASKLISTLLKDNKPAYIRVGRNPVEDIYAENDIPFELNKANILCSGEDVTIIAVGEMVKPAYDCAMILKGKGINASVLDMYCLKPIDRDTILKVAKRSKFVLTVEEHSGFGGLGSMVSQIISSNCPKKVINVSLPDDQIISGNSEKVFEYYGMTADGLSKKVVEILNEI